MFEEINASSTDKPNRREESELLLNERDEKDLAKLLCGTGDELLIFAPATTHLRTIKDVPLLPPEDSQLPIRSSVLALQSLRLNNGYHKTTLKLPGWTFVNEGPSDDSLELWRSYVGPTEYTTIDHAAMINHLQPMLAQTKCLSKLQDKGSISNRLIVDALWDDLSQLTPARWSETHAYATTDHNHFPSPKLPLKSHDTTVNSASHTSSVESVISVTDTLTSRHYGLRVGTKLPISIDTIASDGADMADFGDNPFISENGGTIEVYKEYHLAVEASRNQGGGTLRALATLALESTELTTGKLSGLTFSTALGHRGNQSLPTAYKRAVHLVSEEHLSAPIVE